MKKAQKYRLTLIEGDYFNSKREDFLHSLFGHFSLLSWLSSASKVKVLDKERFYPQNKEVSVYTFTTLNSPNPSFLVEFDKDDMERTISFCPFADRQEMLKSVNAYSLKTKLAVVFSIHQETSKLDVSKKRAVVYIDINDS
jgi:hypothetical protein